MISGFAPRIFVTGVFSLIGMMRIVDGLFLMDNMELEVLFFDDRPIDVSLPIFVNLAVTKADPWVKGDTSGTDTKPVTVETGYQLQVPPFVEEGDKIQIDTRTGEYATRVKE